MMEHTSVLLKETVDSLNVRADGIYVDATLGRGGHSALLASKLKDGHLYSFDKDSRAIEESAERLKKFGDRVTLIHADFRQMKDRLAAFGVTGVDGVMMDLGVSSPQFDDPERGFSYRFDARLDMRMDREQKLDACEVVNTYEAEKLAWIFREYGEERYAGPIARAIEKRRAAAPIETTFQLTDVIKSVLPAKVLNKKGHPAKQVFQALRIEVNGELEALKAGLEAGCDLLNISGRCAVITFHSLEDRMVKQYFKTLTDRPYVDPRIIVKDEEIGSASFLAITRKPIVAGEEELENNRRSHSAKLRVVERKE